MAVGIIDDYLLKNGNAWLKHVFFPLVYGRDASEVYTWNISDSDIDAVIRPKCKKLYNLISNLTISAEYDKLIDSLAWVTYSTTHFGKSNYGKSFSFSSEQLTQVIVNMLKSIKCYYDDEDPIASKQELEYFKKSIFYKTLKDFGCLIQHSDKNYVSADQLAAMNPNKKQAAKPQSDSNSTITKQTSPHITVIDKSQNNQPAKPVAPSNQVDSSATTASAANSSTNVIKNKVVTDAKASKWNLRGPMSQNVRDLVGKPHEKIKLSNEDTLYKIIDADATAQKGKEVRAFIRPLRPDGESNGSNAVFIGSSNNGGDLVCLLYGDQAAKDFMNKAQSIYKVGNLELKSTSIRSNGYFKVNTSLGLPVYILASNLNEGIDEDLDEDVDLTDDIIEDADYDTSYTLDNSESDKYNITLRKFESDDEYKSVMEGLCSDLDKFMS